MSFLSSLTSNTYVKYALIIGLVIVAIFAVKNISEAAT